MFRLLVVSTALLLHVRAQFQTVYGQCGGINYNGPTQCKPPATCTSVNPYYYQCTPSAHTVPTSVQTQYGQCGGSGYNGPTKCDPPTTCSTQNPYYAQCLEPKDSPATTTSASTTKSTTSSSTTSKTSSSTTTTGGSSTTRVANAGVNIAGCDFGCDTNGNCNGVYCPSSVGPSQMQHFASDDRLNVFRLPVGWQYLVNYNLGGNLDANFFKTYDALIQSCLNTGARCIIDIHNYARWNGGIIGQGGPSNAQFTSLWSQLATKYASNSRIIFGLMNEPHDLNMDTWATTVQATVTSIRQAGATSQLILLPGTDYSGAGSFVSKSAPALSKVKDSDGSVTKLIYDVHRYYDGDGSGTGSECGTDHISDSFSPLATYLRQNNRKAFLTETGGGNTQSCVTNVCNALTYLNNNSDVYLGWVGWAAGAFDQGYVLSEVPNNGQDTLLVKSCIAGKFQ